MGLRHHYIQVPTSAPGPGHCLAKGQNQDQIQDPDQIQDQDHGQDEIQVEDQ